MSFLKFAERYPDAAQAKLEAAGRKLDALRKRGICAHGWMQGPPGKAVLTCLDCGREFISRDEHEAARREALCS
jgi:hypothetical protein